LLWHVASPFARNWMVGDEYTIVDMALRLWAHAFKTEVAQAAMDATYPHTRQVA